MLYELTSSLIITTYRKLLDSLFKCVAVYGWWKCTRCHHPYWWKQHTSI